MTTQEMKIPELKGEQIGLYPSKNLVQYLKKYVNRDDWNIVAQLTGYKISTVRDMYYGNASLTEGNYMVLVELSKLALERSQEVVQESQAAVKELKSILRK